MIKQVIKQWEAKKTDIKAKLKPEKMKEISSYTKLFDFLLNEISDEDGIDFDTANGTEIDHGDYQGTLVFVVPVKGYQPSDYYYLLISYGSCSACDTFKSLKCDSSNDDELRDGLMQLMLHMVQGLKKMECGF